MRQCPNCKSDNPDDARFCNYCGMRLPESKEETLYNDLEGLEKARKVEFSDQEIAEESEKVIDEAKKLFEPEWNEEPEENDGLKKQLTIPENLGHMIEEVTREELEQELHRKIKLREQDLKENETPEEESVEEPTRMIGEDSKEEADEPTRMFTGDIGDFIKKKKDYEDVPEEDAYEEILQSWERKRKEKKIKREKEGKDPSRVPQFIRDKRSWSDMTTGQKKAVKRIAAGIIIVAVFCIIEVYHGRPEAVAERYCKAYIQENWKKAGRLSDLPKNRYVTQDEYVSYMKKNAVTGISGYEIKETKENRQTEVESGGKQRAFTVAYKTEDNKEKTKTLIVQKQKKRNFLFFTDWKVSSDEIVANDFNLYLPAGSKAWIDDIKLTEDSKLKDDSDNLEQYKVSLIEGEHKIKVKVPCFRMYRSGFRASDKGNATISKMKISENGKKKFNRKMQDILNAYVKAAKAGKSFSEVAGLFEKDSSCKKENKEFYNDLKKQLGSGDGYITKEVKLDNYEGKYVISGVTGVVRGTLSYDYKVTFKEENKNESRSVSETGDGVEDADGSSQMSAEFVYQNGSYQLRSVNPGNIWYKQLQ